MSQKQPNCALFQAADEGDICGAIAALDLGADLNAVHPQLDDSPLHHAVQRGHYQVAKVLLERGAMVDGARGSSTPPLLDDSTSKEDMVSTESDDGSELVPRHLLLVAVQSGRVELVSLLLEHKANVNVKSEKGMTALMIAAREGHENVVSTLLENGAAVEEETENGMTALLFAARHGHNKVVSILLDNNAAVGTVNEDDCTALMLAAQRGHSQVITTLLDHNTNLDADDDGEYSVLMIAAQHGHSKVITMLLERMARGDPMVLSKQLKGALGFALACAAGNGHDNCIEVLLNDGADIETVDWFSPLLKAAENGHLGTVQYLLEKGARVNPPNDRSTTPLIVAAKKGHTDIVSFLLSGPYSVQIAIDAKDSDSKSALYYAVSLGHKECVKVLAEHGARLDCPDADLKTPLMIAAYNGHAELLSILLEGGASVNVKDRFQKTALMYASENGYLDVLKLQISANVDSMSEKESSTDICTALKHAVKVGTDDCINLLLEHGVDLETTDYYGRTALMLAAHSGQFGALRGLLDKGAHIDHRANRGETALMMAADCAKYTHCNLSDECVRLLLDRGADWKVVDEEGRTALFYANSSSALKVLLDLDLDINHRDKRFRTPLTMAMRSKHFQCVHALCERGADLNIREEDGLTAVLIAAESGSTSCLQLLYAHGANLADTDNDQENILHIAARRGDSDFFKAVRSLDVNIFKELFCARNAAGKTPSMVAKFGLLTRINDGLYSG